MIHHLFTRQKYDDEAFARRMDLARRTCIPSVVAALDGIGPGFRWVWKAHLRHAATIRRVLRSEGFDREIEVTEDFSPPTEPVDIHSTLDSDDRIEPHFLRLQQSYWQEGVQRLISWQPLKQRHSDGQLYRHRYRYEKSGRVSPFYAIYNPDAGLYAYCQSHGVLHKHTSPTWKRDPGAVAVIHDANKLMDLRSRDIPIDVPSEADYR